LISSSKKSSAVSYSINTIITILFGENKMEGTMKGKIKKATVSTITLFGVLLTFSNPNQND